MIERLAERGYLPGPLADAFRRVDRRAFLPAALRPHAALDLPLPLGPAWGHRAAFSPRASALLLMSLEVRRGDRVLIEAADAGYLAALAAELTGPSGSVVLATGSRETAASAGRRLSAAGYRATRARAVAEASWKSGSWDRVLLAEEAAFVPTAARHSLADLGVLVTRVPRGERVEVSRTVRAGAEFADLVLGDLAPVARPLGAGVEEPWPMRRLLTLEEALRRVWTGRPGTPEEAEFEHAVRETWRPLSKAKPTQLDAARKLFHIAYVELMAGDIETAEDAYRSSFQMVPTAEALTFLAWTWSFSGRFEDAIQACMHAVAVDPEFGNAYNDIGAYLIELGKPDEAMQWLESAIRAKRYEARAYPYTNLARARLVIGDVDGAREALAKALDLDPDYGAARDMLRRLDGEPEESDEDADDEGDAESAGA